MYETKTNFGDLHQAGYRAGEETEGGKDLHGKTKIKTEKEQDNVLEAMGAGLDNGNETVTNFGDSHQDGYKIKTEKGQDNVLEAIGAGLDNMNETVTNFGDFHQAWERAGEETKGSKDLHGKNKIKAEKGQDDEHEAMGAGLDNGNENVTNLGDGDLHQAKNGTEDDSKSKTQTETEGGKSLQVETRAGGRGRGRR